MKAKIIFSIFAFLFIVIVDYVFFYFKWFNNYFSYKDIIFVLIISTILLLLFLNLGYKKLFNLKKSAVKFLLFFILFLSLSIFATHRILVINKLYFYIKNYKQNDKGILWQNDDLLSYRGIPNNIGKQPYFIGDSIHDGIYTVFDSLGFRSVSKENKLNNDTLNLFLGCSYTFGSFIKGEETFSYLVSKKINNNYINAGGTGYGAGQMLILLDSLLCKYSFKFVFLQLSPWLTDRAMQMNAPFYYFYRPIPYFSDENYSFKLNFPAYSNTSLTFKHNWNESGPKYIEKLKFAFSDGIKIELIDYFIQKIAKIKISLGILPKPTLRRNELEKYIYKYAIDKCKQKKVTPIVLKIGYPDSTSKDIINYLKPQCLLINLDEDLNNEVVKTGKTYYSLFSIYHIHKGEKIIYDTHPNALANDIIAKKIYRELFNY